LGGGGGGEKAKTFQMNAALGFYFFVVPPGLGEEESL